MAVTLNDIAEHCQLSSGAVSQVLRDTEHRRFSPETRDRILKAAKDLGYVPNRLAGGLRCGQTQLLSLVLPWNTTELMDVAEHTAGRLGYGLIVQFSPTPDPRMEREELLTALERRVDGIAWMPSSDRVADRVLMNQIKKTGTGLVVMGNHLGEQIDADVVEFDYADGCDQAMRHLVQQGYRRVIHVTHNLDQHQPRLHHIEQFLKIVSGYDVRHEVLMGETAGAAGEAVDRCLKRVGEEPVAFYCDHDLYAFDVLRAAKARSLAVPQQIGVISIGDLLIGSRVRFGELTSPTISSVIRPQAVMARHAIEQLVRQIKRHGKQTRRLIMLPMQFIERESTNRRRLSATPTS